MKYPSRAQAFDLLNIHQVPEHIIRHSMVVTHVANVIASALVKSGVDLNEDLVDRAALLHDICKMKAITSGGDHALFGNELLTSMGYPLVGDIIGQHVWLKSFELGEAMVVNYADKRVMHDRIVSIPERFEDLMTRYGTDELRRSRISAHHENTLKVHGIIAASTREDLLDLWNLDLVPGDQTLYG